MADQRRAGLFAWCLFDWANSAVPTVITTFVFAAYFARGVAPDPVTGAALWGQAMGLAGLAVAILSPFLGAVADRGGARKPWIAVFSVVCIAATAALWTIEPTPSAVAAALVLAALGAVAFELTMVFYNAMLPDLVPAERVGRLSGAGWAMGYAGGLVCLALCLVGLIQADPPPFGLDKSAAEPVRAVALVTAGWFLVFSLPFFLLTTDRPATGAPVLATMAAGARTLAATLRNLRRHANVARFLGASLLYLGGLQTLFSFGGIYAAGTFGMDTGEIIQFGIALNVTAGLGAFAFSRLDSRLGARKTILYALAGLLVTSAAILLTTSVAWFWVFALGLGIFIGPAQAAGRSLMARLAPPGLEAEMFGLYALSGKATNFVGPSVLAAATLASGSQRIGMATILVFFAAGFALLLGVREPAR